MPLQILELPKQFRPATSIVYPPFKNGRYMEEYFYEYATTKKEDLNAKAVYIPIFWTNLQTHKAFTDMKEGLTVILRKAIQALPPDTKYFTVVQHDDGPLLQLPPNTMIFGACSGSIPLPLIYEDVTDKLLSTPRKPVKPYLASFVGTLTHLVRTRMVETLKKNNNIKMFTKPHGEWTNSVKTSAADEFINTTLASKFCLAPRGYGRSSFRFFEAMLLDTVPVYFWDDVEWLPYKDVLDYSKFSVSIHMSDIPRTYAILKSISNEKYENMIEEIRRVRHYFTLEGMSEYIISKV